MCIPVVWSYFQPHFFHLHDYTHVARLSELERGFADGQLPVRWSQNLGYGYGMPQFSFYGPLFYLQALFFRIFFFSYIDSVKLAVSLQVFISFLALFKLGELLSNKWGGILAGIAGVYAPYRLVDMYVRGAFAELAGMTMVALTLYFMTLWANKPSEKKAMLIGLTSAGIVLSHTLMGLISALFIGLYYLFLIKNYKRWFGFNRQILTSIVIAFGLSAFFAIPALAEKSYTQADKLTTGFSNYNHHFLYIRQLWQSAWGYGGSIWGLDDNVSFELGKVQIITIIATLFMAFALFVRRRKINRFIVVFGILTTLQLFLTILKSKPIWDILPILTYIQFPWRFLSIASIFAGILCSMLVLFIPKKLVPLTTLILAGLMILTQINHLKPESFLTDDKLLYYDDPLLIRTKMSDVIPDFLPFKANLDGLVVPAAIDSKVKLNPDINMSIPVQRSHEFLVYAETNKPFDLETNIFDFPGWTLYLNGKEIEHSQTANGLIRATIPVVTDYNYISGRFEETFLRQTANLFSFLTVVYVTQIVVSKKSKKQI